MINDLNELKRLLKIPAQKGGYAGVVLYDGPSQLDGAPIIVIANRIETKSTNSKTGNMVQTWIMRKDVKPTLALKSGEDSSVCGNCPHRPINGGACYVTVFQAPLGVWKAFHRNRYLRAGIDFEKALLPKLFAGKAFRMGSYGDPAAAPFQMWRMVTLSTLFINGYSHQWRDSRFQAFRLIAMASADSKAEMDVAHSMGWRTFRVRGEDESLIKGLEAVCPASKEAGHKTDCASCKACGGNSAKAKVSMVIMAHGAKANRFSVTA